MERQQARSYFKKQVESIDKNIFKACFLNDEKAIHDLRVAIKRLRALFKILREHQCLKRSHSKYLRIIKKLYVPLGKLRDLQLKTSLYHHHHLNDSDDYPYFNKWLKGQQFRSKTQLKHLFKNFSYSSFYSFKHSNPLPGNRRYPIDNVEVIEQRLDKIKKLLANDHSEKNLHDIRKKLKEIYYFMEMNHLDEIECSGLILNLEKIKALEDKIGGWRDLLLFKKDMHLNGMAQGKNLSTGQINAKNQMDKSINYLYKEINHSLKYYL